MIGTYVSMYVVDTNEWRNPISLYYSCPVGPVVAIVHLRKFYTAFMHSLAWMDDIVVKISWHF